MGSILPPARASGSFEIWRASLATVLQDPEIRKAIDSALERPDRPTAAWLLRLASVAEEILEEVKVPQSGWRGTGGAKKRETGLKP